MRGLTILTGAALVAAALTVPITGPVLAQGKPQTIAEVNVDVHSLASGYRVSKIIGSSVVDDQNTTIGTINDLIITPNDRVPYAILSVGGFLGMGTKYVVVPYSVLQPHDKTMMLPGATRESLKALPEFKYNT